MSIEELRPLLRPGGVLLLGENPGTVEAPALVAALADAALETNPEVIVGLELPLTEPVDGSAHGPFFDRPDELRDGRSSRAMSSLVHRLANLDGARPVALDGPWVAPGAPIPLEHIGLLHQPRDAVMAGRLLAEIDLVPQAPTIVLAGSMHTRVDRANQTLGGLISPWFPRMVSLLLLATSGSAWKLSADGGGPQPLPADPGLEPGARWAPEPGADGHHGYVNLGAVTASPPA